MSGQPWPHHRDNRLDNPRDNPGRALDNPRDNPSRAWGTGGDPIERFYPLPRDRQRAASPRPLARTNETKRFPGWGHFRSHPPTSDPTISILVPSPVCARRPTSGLRRHGGFPARETQRARRLKLSTSLCARPRVWQAHYASTALRSSDQTSLLTCLLYTPHLSRPVIVNGGSA